MTHEAGAPALGPLAFELRGDTAAYVAALAELSAGLEVTGDKEPK